VLCHWCRHCFKLRIVFVNPFDFSDSCVYVFKIWMKLCILVMRIGLLFADSYTFLSPPKEGRLCFYVCLFVCLSARLLKKLPSGFDQIFWRWGRPKKQSITF